MKTKQKYLLKNIIFLMLILLTGKLIDNMVDSILVTIFGLIVLSILGSLILIKFHKDLGTKKLLEYIKTNQYSLDFKIPENIEISEEEKNEISNIMNNIRGNLKNQIGISTDIYEKCEDLYRLSTETLASAEAISSTVDTTDANIYEQRNMVIETNRLVENMNESMKEMELEIGDKIGLITDSLTSAEGGLKSIEEIEERVRATKEMSDKTSIRVGRLQEYSDEVAGLIDLIVGISNETKMLSLNASIEAARAGEEGRGFAIVAQEVGKLASETDHASKKIEEVISTLQEEIEKIDIYMKEEIEYLDKSYLIVENTSSGLGSVLESLNIGRESLEEIHSFTEENTTIIEEITLNVNKINTFSEETTTEMLKTTKQTEGQYKRAKYLEESLNSIKKDVFTLQQSVGGKLLESRMLEKLDNIRERIVNEDSFSKDDLNDISKDVSIDSIYITDIYGVVKYSNEPKSIGLNLYEIDTEIAKLKNGNMDYISSPIKKRVEDGKLFKFLTIKDSKDRLIEIGIGIESVINNI